MATMISEVYAAFRAAGVDEEHAQKAAEALSNEALATKADVSRIERELLTRRDPPQVLCLSELVKAEMRRSYPDFPAGSMQHGKSY